MSLPTLLDILKLILLPAVSTAYLGLCWIVHSRIVLVNGYGIVDTLPENFCKYKPLVSSIESNEMFQATIKSGITTINILVIALGLWPIKSLIVDVKSEEFFRLLRRTTPGPRSGSSSVDLFTAYLVSLPTLGAFSTIKVVLGRRCTPYFSMAFVAGFLVMTASALAPAALSVQITPRHSDITTLTVAAIRPSSVAAPHTAPPMLSYSEYYLTQEMQSELQEAASVTWAEAALNVTYSFQVSPSGYELNGHPQYIVPLPVDLVPEASEKWLTDAFVLHPFCNWQPTNITKMLQSEDLVCEPDSCTAPVAIPALDIGLQLDLQNESARHSKMRYASAEAGKGYRIFNSTTNDIPHGGYSIWAVLNYQPNTTEMIRFLKFDTVGLPAFDVMLEEHGIWQVAVLACSPNFTIQTVEAQKWGKEITVSPTSSFSDGPITTQGNLDQGEGEKFFTALFAELGEEASPALPIVSGSQIQASLVFGWDSVRAFNPDLGSAIPNPPTWQAMPIKNITAMYSRYIQSAAKPYMTGILGNAEVPGVNCEMVIAFTVSPAHVIASTVLLISLNIFNAWAFFRSGKGEVFNLLTIASILNQSNVPANMAGIRENSPNILGEELDRAFESASKDRVLTLVSCSHNHDQMVLAVCDHDMV
ncbi:hypothetical protein AX16_005159 [Volvariella volvacea WC 439]|nr:hypothetical protein AX16_005159 [Volvariella volvacea WC 439]